MFSLVGLTMLIIIIDSYVPMLATEESAKSINLTAATATHAGVLSIRSGRCPARAGKCGWELSPGKEGQSQKVDFFIIRDD